MLAHDKYVHILFKYTGTYMSKKKKKHTYKTWVKNKKLPHLAAGVDAPTASQKTGHSIRVTSERVGRPLRRGPNVPHHYSPVGRTARQHGPVGGHLLFVSLLLLCAGTR